MDGMLGHLFRTQDSMIHPYFMQHALGLIMLILIMIGPYFIKSTGRVLNRPRLLSGLRHWLPIDIEPHPLAIVTC